MQCSNLFTLPEFRNRGLAEMHLKICGDAFSKELCAVSDFRFFSEILYFAVKVCNRSSTSTSFISICLSRQEKIRYGRVGSY